MQKLWIDAEILQGSPIGVAIIESATGKILDANDGYCQIMGRPTDKVIGKTWMHFTHPDDICRDLVFVHEASTGVAKRSVRTKRYVDPGGDVVHADVSICPVAEKRDPFDDTVSILAAPDAGVRYLEVVVNRNRESIYRERLHETIEEVHREREAFCAAVAELTQFRDRETGAHLQRTMAYVRLLLKNLPDGNLFGDHGVRLITRASMLHDVGKVGIPDSILLKEGPLTNEEYLAMQTHTVLGANVIKRMIRVGENDPLLMFAMQIAASHHERWDGKGYPDHIGGERIPLVARIMAIADVYDALRSERCYKESMTHPEAVEIINAGAGTQFDPALVTSFMNLNEQFNEIANTEEYVLQQSEA